jgi:hypothetical protein
MTVERRTSNAAFSTSALQSQLNLAPERKGEWIDHQFGDPSVIS